MAAFRKVSQYRARDLANTAWSLARVKCGVGLALLKASSTHAGSQWPFVLPQEDSGVIQLSMNIRLATFGDACHGHDFDGSLKETQGVRSAAFGQQCMESCKLGRCKEAAGRSYIS